MRLEAKIFWLLALSFAVGLIFDLIPWAPAEAKKLFVFVDGRDFGVTLEWYVYLCCEKVSRMAIFAAFSLATGFEIVHTFFIIECMDLGDYMLVMNRPWTEILGFPLEFNHWKLCIILTVFVKQWTTLHSFGS